MMPGAAKGRDGLSETEAIAEIAVTARAQPTMRVVKRMSELIETKGGNESRLYVWRGERQSGIPDL